LVITNFLTYGERNRKRYRKDPLEDPDGAREAVERHKKIVMALRLKDKELCERIMRDHIEQAKESALQSLFGKS